MRLGLILAILLALLSPAYGADNHDIELFFQSERGQYYAQHRYTESFIDDPAWVDAASDPLFAKAYEEFRAGNFGNAARLLPPLAEKGHAKAQLLLGILHYQGHGVEKSIDQAVDWIKQAVEQGLLAAQVVLSEIYVDTKQNDLAIQMLQKAAERGHSLSQIFLALYYETGVPWLPRDEAKGFEWLLKAAEAGEPFAMGQVADRYRLGVEVTLDGAAVMPDIVEAIRWAFAAAERNDPVGQYLLGDIYTYQFGSSHFTNPEKGIVWYRRAAEQGHLVAQHELAGSYRHGHGVSKDLVTAYMWAKLAGRNVLFGHHIRKLASEMTPEQVAEGEKRAREWLEQKGLPTQ